MTNPVTGGFQFTPPTGLNDVAAYPTTPVSETAARQQVMDLYWQLMNEMNSPTLSAAAYAQYNKLINGNFDVWQDGTSFTTSRYGPDQWYFDLSNATVNRQSAGVPLGSKYIARLTMNATGFGNAYQVFESEKVQKFIGKTVTFSVKIRRNATLAANMVLIVQKGTVADTLLGGVWTDLSSTVVNNSVITTGTTFADWYTASVTVTIPNDGTVAGLRVQVSMVSSQPVGAYYEISQAQLTQSGTLIPFQPKSYQEELDSCHYFYEKSYNIIDIPGTVVDNGSFFYRTRDAIAGSASGVIYLGSVTFKKRKRIAPTVKIYSPSTGVLNAVRVMIGADRTGATANLISENGFSRLSFDTTSATAIVADNTIDFHYTADARL